MLLNGTPITATTNYVDATADLTQVNEYSLRPVIGGLEQPSAGSFTLPANAAINQYLSIPLQIPPGGVTPVGGAYTYNANDASVGDLDGDGEYEIVLKWDPSNSQDNANDGYTGNVYIDAYKLDGTRLWRIDLGRNIRDGAHYTQFMVYDLDGDGKAEVACKTADGTVDGDGTVIGDGGGATIAARPAGFSPGPSSSPSSTARPVRRSPRPTTSRPAAMSAAGATTAPGGRMLRQPRRSLPGCRRLPRRRAAQPRHVPRLLHRAVLAAWDWRDGKLTHVWTFDSDDGTPGNDAYRGQGNHNLTVGDVDGDGKDEIVYGAAAIDDNGTGLYSTAWATATRSPLRHGSGPPGPRGLQPHEVAVGSQRRVSAMRERAGSSGACARQPTMAGAWLRTSIRPAQATRCGPRRVWACATGSATRSAPRRLPSTSPSGGTAIRCARCSTAISTLGPVILSKWNWTTNTSTTLLSLPFTEVMTNNGTKANPVLTGDILGDWREEVILRTRRQHGAAHLHDDDPGHEPPLHADARPAVPTRHRLAERRLQPAAPPELLPRRRHGASAHPGYHHGPRSSGAGRARLSILTVTTDSGVSATDRITNDNTLVLGGTADAGNTVTVSKVGVGVIGTTPADGTGAWSFDYSGTSLADGSHFFTATADDGLGHTSGAMPPFQVYVDTVAPSRPLQQPSEPPE